MLVTVFCSGSIQKGPADKGKNFYWTNVERSALAEAAHPLQVRFLNPDDPVEDLSDTLALFGRDMYQVQFADFVVVDAREKRGIGIGTEMVASKVFDTPLIVVCPADTHYRKSKVDYRGSSVNNYIHPHLYGLADAIVDDFNAAGAWIKQYMKHPTKAKSTDALSNAIDEYKTRMLAKDLPMLEILREVEIVGKEYAAYKDHIPLRDAVPVEHQDKEKSSPC